jgi:peptide/nickel transport system ATP-binding protein
MLFISHDLAVVRSLADRVGVLFTGELVACDTVSAVFRPPLHPYTQRLLDAVPDLHAAGRTDR